MDLNSRKRALARAGIRMMEDSPGRAHILHETEIHNPWFTRFHCELMLQSFAGKMLREELLTEWAARYGSLPEKEKTIGLICAGNIPFAGMHDLLCVLMSGCRAQVKLSSKDRHFFPWFRTLLAETEPALAGRIAFAEKLSGFDAVIATGSNNTGRYFDYYFGKYPHIIRRNRVSVAVIEGDESEEALHDLGKDVFYYYGLGCRNVSMLCLPEFFGVEKLFRIWEDFRYVLDNIKYKNNYDYNRSLLLLNRTEHLANDFFMMVRDGGILSPLATLHYTFYSEEGALAQMLAEQSASIQCVLRQKPGYVPFGQSQFPGLGDYADHIDTMEFLGSL